LASEDLFVTDTKPDEKIRHKYISTHRPLKADQILAERSAIPALLSHKRPSETSLVESRSKKLKKDGVSHKEYQRLRQVAYGGESVHKDVVKNEGDATYDPWDDAEPEPVHEYNFLEKKKPRKEPTTLKAKPVSLAENGREVKAVRRPAQEKSYNPTFQDWNDRLERVGEQEILKEKKRLEDAAKQEELKMKIQQAREEEEMLKGVDSEWESEWEGFASENEEKPEWAQKMPGRKTKVQRNKIARRKAEEGKKKHEAKQKAKQQQAERIKKLAKEVKEKERLKKEKEAQLALVPVEDSSDDGEEVEIRRKRFGKAPVPEAPLEVLLMDELPDSLRRLKPQGNVMTDRYRSLLLRGKVEPRKAHQRKNPQKKYTEKWSYKDWKLK